MQIRRARPVDAVAIAAVHVSAWRSAYAGILPDRVLTRLSQEPQAVQYDADIRAGRGVYVAVAESGAVVGFATAGRARAQGIAEGEVETLYVLDDWREQGAGRRLLQAGASHLAVSGCRSLFLWVLTENPSRWFYERMGGRAGMAGHTTVGGVLVPQTAYVWADIERLLVQS